MRNRIAPVKCWRSLAFVCCLALAPGLGAAPARAPVVEVNLARTYHPGYRMIYDTQITTRAFIQSDSTALDSFLPEIPRAITIRQKNTLSVEKVLPNGSTELQDRFDAFDLLSGANGAKAVDRSDQRRIDSEVSRAMTGQVVTVRYDRHGNLLGFTGAKSLFQQMEAPSREAARLALRVFLAQLGGSGFYPGRVRVGDTWQKKTATSINSAMPAFFQDATTFQYQGSTRYRGVSAAAIGFRFTNSLKPAARSKAPGGLLALLKARGATLDFSVTGSGSGTALIALSDGRILRNDSTFQESLRGSLKGFPGVAGPASRPATLEVQTRNSVQTVEVMSEE
jgi:hypothetical protein